LGVVLLKRYITGIHFDVACVYEGSLLQVALDTVEVAGFQVPRGLVTVVPVLVLNLFVMTVLWKELKLTSFDPALATAMGFSATALHYLLMVLVAVTTVASFEAVGSILVVAMLIVPPATAHLFCDRLSRMVIVATLVAIASAVVGYWFAHVWDVAPAGAMAVAAGGLYALAVLFSPQYGLISALVHQLQTSLRILREDLLSMLYRVEEVGAGRKLDTQDALAAVGGGFLAHWALWMLRHRGRIEEQAGVLTMTDDGRTRARKLVRTHRLWETYLVKHLGLALDHVHEPAHRVEHFTGPQIQQQLTEAVDDAARDPHGRDIPG
jgi:manganese/zinc/iron transport system permease protein